MHYIRIYISLLLLFILNANARTPKVHISRVWFKDLHLVLLSPLTFLLSFLALHSLSLQISSFAFFVPSHRALQFIVVFLEEVLTGEQDLVKCAKKAYEASLKRYHGWMVQGVFSVGFIN